MGKLICPECDGELYVDVKLLRTIRYSDGGYEAQGIFSSLANWDYEKECGDDGCNGENCSQEHNFDKQQNRELLLGGRQLAVILDVNDEYDTVTTDHGVVVRFVCPDCDFTHDVPEEREVSIEWV